MRTSFKKAKRNYFAFILAVCAILLGAASTRAQQIKNVVLVHGAFADGADIPKDQAGFMYASQGSFAGKCFTTPITHAAWRDKPTFGCIATEDKSINPDIQRAMYKRSNTKTVDVKGSHVIFMSQPQAVAKMIEEASNVNVK
jgi:hypothetical protein